MYSASVSSNSRPEKEGKMKNLWLVMSGVTMRLFLLLATRCLQLWSLWAINVS
jgi:hypothetical protein